MKKIFLTTLILCQVVFHSFSQDSIAKQYAELVTPEELKDNLSILASDSLEGRDTGTRGQKMAAAFIASYFEEIGLESPTNKDYFQRQELNKISITRAHLKFEDEDYYSDDIIFWGKNPPKNQNTEELVYIGYGDEQNFQLIDVTGKCVLILLKDSLDSTWSKAVNLAHERGAKEVFEISFPEDEKCIPFLEKIAKFASKGFMEMKNFPSEYQAQSFSMRSSLAAKLMKTTIDSLISIARNFSVEFNTLKPVEITYSVEFEEEIIETENILGYLEGSEKSDEVLIISAHYDHVGISFEGVDKIRNGADDNGSGTVAMMNIAKSFMKAKEDGYKPKRSILFVAFTAEEKGLYGSKYYIENPVIPLEKTITNLNIDMIGRRDTLHSDEPYVYILGSDRTSDDLHILNEMVNDNCCGLALDYTYNDPDDPLKMYERSDQWNFVQKNIPVIFYFSGLHEDYHKPSDEVDKIDFDLLTQRTKLVFNTAWEIANREKAVVNGLIIEPESN